MNGSESAKAMGLNLIEDDDLRVAVQDAADESTWSAEESAWVERLTNTLQRVKAADLSERRSRPFQEFLWEQNEVSAVGRGNISVTAALDDDGFRNWLAEVSMKPLPSTSATQMTFLSNLYEEIKSRIGKPESRTPHLKIYRVLAALYPEAMTTVADTGELAALGRKVGADPKLTPASRHVAIRHRVDALLPTLDGSLRSHAVAMVVPWLVRKRSLAAIKGNQGKADGAVVALTPLPAAQRLRSLVSIPDGFEGLLAWLEYVGDGVPFEDFIEFVKDQLPNLKASSVRVMANGFIRQLDLVKLDGDRLIRTERGENLAASQDPSELSDWFLTRILGCDHVIVAVRDSGPQTQRQLLDVIKSANPHLTTNYAPSVLLRWLRLLGVFLQDASGKSELSEVGRQWAAMVTWKPESLATAVGPETDEIDPPMLDKVALPDAEEVVKAIRAKGQFDPAQIAFLHAWLWAHPRRHFAIFSGLSGAGKTLLAREYGMALGATVENGRLLTLPIQPGWQDPGALLGYVNPLRSDSYVSTPFLALLLRASQEPAKPHVVVLDEMNLSHPEQYIAPLLSAMETGERIVLHSEPDAVDQIPPSVPYPENLVIIGTINMDETTMGVSDKVLDRAFVMEFWSIDLNQYPHWDTRGIPQADEQRVRDILGRFLELLQPSRLHFGWRVVDEVLDFVQQCGQLAKSIDVNQVMDQAVYAKVLPKLRGQESPALHAALGDCVQAAKALHLTRSAVKLQFMLEMLKQTGTVHFWR